jgi:hypothetical protein
VEFLAIQPPTFTEASEPLEADHWLCTIEFEFELINCTENQKTLFAAQQLLGDAKAWLASFTTTRLLTKCSGLSSVKPSVRSIFQQAS